MNIYVGNLPYNITEEELRSTFEEFGNITEVTIIQDRMTGQSKGFGFVEMPDNSEADAAIKGLNEKNVKGRNLKVNQAKPREARPPQRHPRY